METTRVSFNTTLKVKKAAQKRVRIEGTTLTSLLNQTMVLYAEGAFDPDDFLTKADVLAIRRAEADIKAGRVYSLEEVSTQLGL